MASPRFPVTRFPVALRHLVDLARETLPPMHPAGRPFVAAGVTTTLLLRWLSPTAGTLGAVATACCAAFFREPHRVSPQDPGLAVAPADGTVSSVGLAPAPAELGLNGQPRPRGSGSLGERHRRARLRRPTTSTPRRRRPAAGRLRAQDVQALRGGRRRPVGARAGQGGVDVRHGEDPDQQRDGVARQPVRVALAVGPLVVPADQRDDVPQRLQGLHHGDALVWDRWRWLQRRVRQTHNADRLLDIGCGSGAFTIGMAKRGYQRLGLSWDARNQKVAQQRADICGASNATFEICDVRQLHERTDLFGMFDIILCCENIEHIIDDFLLMKSMAACLKPGGRLLLTAPYIRRIPQSSMDYGPFPDFEDGRHVRPGYNRAIIAELCVHSGLHGRMTRNTPTLAHTKTNINTVSRCSQSSMPRFPSSGDSRSSAVTEPALSEAGRFVRNELGGKGVLGFEVTRRSISAPAERNLRRRLPMSNKNPLQHFTTSGP